jgi:hypothetical protein
LDNGDNSGNNPAELLIRKIAGHDKMFAAGCHSSLFILFSLEIHAIRLKIRDKTANRTTAGK